ncbi:sensor histidine kinase [Paenibacillus sp. J2TS4]|uniref:cache domain-containing sensor histidine kinase n=1 Tax=Paenibacillus sp. J2TS4 TaxID=2807194 RepID=UPI001B0D429C|nr:sensor histidine kinase [Paenibacillus sp. J2TS4]GIP33249.1 histidine kinase [Paenibacillus sp. J2TS4]
MWKSSLAFKVFTSFVIVIVVTLTIVSVSTYVTSSRELDQLHEEMLTQIVDNALHHTDLYLKSYERATLSLLTSSYVKQFLDAEQNHYFAYYSLSAHIKEELFKPIFINNPEISMIYLISYNGMSLHDFNIDYPGFTDSDLTESLEDLREQTKEDGSLSLIDWSFLDGQLTLARKISGRQTSKLFKGIVGIELRIEELTTLWKGIRLGDQGYFFIVNDRGKIVYDPNKAKIGKQLDGRLFEQVRDHAGAFFINQEEGENQPQRVYFSRRSDYSGWTLVSSMPLEAVRKPVLNIRQTTLIASAVSVILALLVAFRFGRAIISPIRMLEQGMRRTEKGDWTKVPLRGKKDEMDRLIHSYNLMVARLSELVERVYESELKNQDNLFKRQLAEFQSLQLQINPHFLYNTLETIICYAVVQDSEEIKEIVRSMSLMLRYSVQTDLEEITVANELKHVLHYMTIMNYRFEQPFEVQVHIPPEFLLKKMVRLTLQPLVENAFKHAFPDGIEDYHFIRINAEAEGGQLTITVEDNGQGMTEEERAALQRNLEAGQSQPINKQGGIGLINVHNRIQMVFGEQYGLSVKSVPGEGTAFTLTMPDTDAIRFVGMGNRQLKLRDRNVNQYNELFPD